MTEPPGRLNPQVIILIIIISLSLSLIPTYLKSGVGRHVLYISNTSSGMLMYASMDASCSINASGKIGERSSGFSISLVFGFNGGGGFVGRSATMLYHCIGISLSSKLIFLLLLNVFDCVARAMMGEYGVLLERPENDQ